jgi:hypothetical protein
MFLSSDLERSNSPRKPIFSASFLRGATFRIDRPKWRADFRDPRSDNAKDGTSPARESSQTVIPSERSEPRDLGGGFRKIVPAAPTRIPPLGRFVPSVGMTLRERGMGG